MLWRQCDAKADAPRTEHRCGEAALADDRVDHGRPLCSFVVMAQGVEKRKVADHCFLQWLKGWNLLHGDLFQISIDPDRHD